MAQEFIYTLLSSSPNIFQDFEAQVAFQAQIIQLNDKFIFKLRIETVSVRET